METERLWIRLGDNADYEECGSDFGALAELLEMFNVSQDDMQWRTDGMGFQTESFYGNNYVSLFWGDEDAQPIRGLTRQEQESIQY